MTPSSSDEPHPEDHYAQVPEMEVGLDRANITSCGQIKLPTLDTNQEPDVVIDKDRRESSGLVNALKERKHQAANKIRKKLHRPQKFEDEETPGPILADAREEDSGSRLVQDTPDTEKHSVKDFLRNPVDTISSKLSNQGNQQVAGHIAAQEMPHGQEVDLIKAHEATVHATTEEDKLDAQQHEAEMIKARQSTFARWSLDRHVTKVRLLPRAMMIRKSKTDFQFKNQRGELMTDWSSYRKHLLVFYAHQYGGQYIGYGSDPPAPSKETIMPNFERLIIATAPFQEVIMTTRKVALWDNPQATIKYLLIYMILWYLNLLLPGALSFLIYLVLERRLHGQSLQDLRRDIEHREDQETTALSLSEFIVKRGDEKWADDILQVLGPWLMVQLADLANFFESMRNFYEWRKPYRTLAALAVLTCCILATIFIPTWLLIKTSTLAMGLTFFGLFPLSVKFPEYRLLVSPTKRILWNIPTHAEWAVQYVQAEGARVLRDTKAHANITQLSGAVPITNSSDARYTQDIGSYNAHHDKGPGRLTIGATSCRFVSNIGHIMHFHLSYDEINKIEKQDRIVAKKMPAHLTSDTGQDLKLIPKTGQAFLLKDVERRNEAFSQIVGFSTATWQIVW